MLSQVIDSVGVLRGSVGSSGGGVGCLLLLGLVFVLVCVVVVPGIGVLQPTLVLSTNGILGADNLGEIMCYL